MPRRYVALLTLMLLLGAACDSELIPRVASPLSPMASPPLTPTSLPTAAPTLKITTTPTLRPISTATSLPTVIPALAEVAPPPGLMFATYGEYGLWQIDMNGDSRKVLDHLPVSVSTEGSHVIYNDHDVFWMYDLNTGKRVNLTEIVGRQVCCFQWFSARPEDVFFNAGLPGKQIPPFTAGFLMMLHLNTEEQRALDGKNISFTAPTLSPDGQTITYDRLGKGWVYQLDGTAQEIDPSAYGLSEVETMVNPVWSPNGRWLAWAVFNGNQWGYGVFHLKEQVAQLFHEHDSAVFEGWPERAAWSPDSRWLALNIYSRDSGDNGIWIVSMHDEKEYHLGNGHSGMIWSPDGRWLASGRTIYEVGKWRPQLLDLPADAEIVAWVSPTQ